MTDTDERPVEPAAPAPADEPLPEVMTCTMAALEAMGRRIPSPRLTESLKRIGITYGELMNDDAGRMRYAAFRLLLRDYPDRDLTSLWLHSYFVEIEVTEVDPSLLAGTTTSPPSADTSAASPGTSTS
jgi:hypothetical protein